MPRATWRYTNRSLNKIWSIVAWIRLGDLWPLFVDVRNIIVMRAFFAQLILNKTTTGGNITWILWEKLWIYSIWFILYESYHMRHIIWPENENFVQNFGWAFQDLPIMLNMNYIIEMKRLPIWMDLYKIYYIKTNT